MAPTNGVMVKFDIPMRERLRKAYKAALKAGETQFVFEDNEYLTTYAGYMLEYLDRTLE